MIKSAMQFFMVISPKNFYFSQVLHLNQKSIDKCPPVFSRECYFTPNIHSIKVAWEFRKEYREKNSALERLKNVEIFDSDSIFNRKTKEKKASVNEWSAAVRDKVSNIISRKNDLLTRHNEILAQIRSLSFVSTNDDLQNFFIPPGYSVSNNGIEKVADEFMISV